MTDREQTEASKTIRVPFGWYCACGSGTYRYADGWKCVQCGTPWPNADDLADQACDRETISGG